MLFMGGGGGGPVETSPGFDIVGSEAGLFDDVLMGAMYVALLCRETSDAVGLRVASDVDVGFAIVLRLATAML